MTVNKHIREEKEAGGFESRQSHQPPRSTHPTMNDWTRHNASSIEFINPPQRHRHGFETAKGLIGACCEKLLEVEDRLRFLDERDKALSHACSEANPEKYSTAWLTARVAFERIEAERSVVFKWRRYWMEMGGFLPRVTVDYSIEKAKDRLLTDLYDGELRKAGKSLVGLCPFHEDHRPSFYIYTETNKFKCFACGANGDSIDFLTLQGVCFKDAVRRLS